MRLYLAAISILMLVVAGGCRKDNGITESKFPIRQVTVRGVDFGYRIYVPPHLPEGQKPPIMLYLHGSNRRGNDNRSPLNDLSEIIRDHPENFPYIIVFPQCQPKTFWAGPMMEMAIEALNQTIKEFNADESRIYLAGYSMGGFGAWQTAITLPYKFAAIVSVAGGVEPLGEISDEDQRLLSKEVRAAAASSNTYQAYAEELSAIPAWLVHGAKDESVPVDASRKLSEALKAAGNKDVHYRELENVGHASLNDTFIDPELTTWLLKQHK